MCILQTNQWLDLKNKSRLITLIRPLYIAVVQFKHTSVLQEIHNWSLKAECHDWAVYWTDLLTEYLVKQSCDREWCSSFTIDSVSNNRSPSLFCGI